MEFLKFPVEIQGMIISHLPSMSDLAALSQSCRSLNRLCDMNTRERFHQIRVVSNDEDQSINKSFDLLMEILKEPKLGNYVREIIQARKPPAKYVWAMMKEQRQVSENDKVLLHAAVQNAGFTGSQEDAVLNMFMIKNTRRLPAPNRVTVDFLHGYKSGAGRIESTYITQALAALLISVSPNLESLVIAEPFTTCSGLGTFRGGQEPPDSPDLLFPLDQMLRRKNADPASLPYLQNLRKVYMIVCDEESDGRFYESIDFLECVTLFDKIPSIESISTDAMYLDDMARKTLEPRSSNISRIHINHSALQTFELATIVLSCKELRELQYSIGGLNVAEGWFASFNAKAFIKSIYPHKDTLEILDIDAERNMLYFQSFHYNEDRVDQEIDDDTAWALDDNGDIDRYNLVQSLQGNIGSLKDFHALKQLSLGIGFFVYFAMGVRKNGESEPRKPLIITEAFPESLEYLCIRGYERGVCKVWDEHIDALMGAFNSGSLGSLKEITGIEKTIPNAEDVEDPDADADKLWRPIYGV